MIKLIALILTALAVIALVACLKTTCKKNLQVQSRAYVEGLITTRKENLQVVFKSVSRLKEKIKYKKPSMPDRNS